MNSINWRKPAERLSLLPGEIHLWRASLARNIDSLAAILSYEELQRGQRFRCEEHRRRFCLARAGLRFILAHYLPIAPRQIVFREGPYGKLYLAGGAMELQFNLSHSRDLALYAVTLDCEIGVDTEWINPDLPVQPLVARFFAPSEQAILDLPASQQLAAFYRLWTRKEAYLKALGLGLSGLSHALTEDRPGSIMGVEPAPEYAGALALAGDHRIDPAHLNYFQIFDIC